MNWFQLDFYLPQKDIGAIIQPYPDSLDSSTDTRLYWILLCGKMPDLVIAGMSVNNQVKNAMNTDLPSSMWENIWFLLNIDILKDREVSFYLWAVVYNVAYFEVIYVKCISVTF